MKAAHIRFKLALSITAGYDTRLLLAASKEISKDIMIYSQMTPGMDEKHYDIWVPVALLSDLVMNVKHYSRLTTIIIPGSVKHIYLSPKS
jgi:hypothetical protein